MKKVFEWDGIFLATGYYSKDNYIIFKAIKKATKKSGKRRLLKI